MAVFDIIIIMIMMMIIIITTTKFQFRWPRSEAWVCGLSLSGIAGSNSAGVMDISLL
jgi:hypothetical protein